MTDDSKRMATLADHRDAVALTRAWMTDDTEAIHAVLMACDPPALVTALLDAYTQALFCTLKDPDAYLRLVQERLTAIEAGDLP